MSGPLPPVVSAFLAAVEDRDAAAVGRCLTEAAVYHFLMPHPPVIGRTAVQDTFARVLGEATRVRWDIVTSAVAGDRVFLERVDRFWFGDREAAIECTGVMELHGGRIAVVRDYADLSTWQARKSEAQDAG
jgi:limonene-1,2-epoxide hydrolase